MVVLLGTAGYALIGTLLAAMSVQSRTHEMLLPILLFPVAIPLILASVKASSGYLQAFPAVDIQPWITLLIVNDVLFTALGLMMFESLMEE
jgi:heme exporter protein B